MKKQIIFYPFFLTLFPILSLFAHNQANVLPRELIWPILIVLPITALLWFLLNLVFKDNQKSACFATAFIFLLFSYGTIQQIANRYGLMPIDTEIAFGYFLFLCGLLVIVTAERAMRSRKLSFAPVTQFLNRFGIFLLLLPVVSIAQYHLSAQAGAASTTDTLAGIGFSVHASDLSTQVPPNPSSKDLPDIYYIILDAYGRADQLKQVFDYDNGAFVDALRQRGFHVNDHARSNYNQTLLSLSSSLNMTHLDTLTSEIGTTTDNRGWVGQMIMDNQVSYFLKSQGYNVVAISSGFLPTTNIRAADQFITPQFTLSAFNNALFGMTPLPKTAEGLSLKSLQDLKREQTYFVFDQLKKTPNNAKPTFTFVHVMSPHPPFLFHADGTPTKDTETHLLFEDGSQFYEGGGTQQEYHDYYPQQVQMLNTLVLKTMDSILTMAQRPTVIILQGDHGSGSQLDWEHLEKSNLPERLSILNAIYLPDHNYQQLSDDETPVNTFRILFNKYFNTNLALLPDTSYFATWSHPYEFIDVTDKVK